MPKLFIAGLIVEINTFSMIPTTNKSFEECYFKMEGLTGYGEHYWGRPLKLWQEQAKILDWECVSGFCAGAMPAGRVLDSTFYEYFNIILRQIESAHAKASLDAILLHLHGAMASQSIDDCEGYILERIRMVVGKDVFIGVLLDPHTNLTLQMTDNANLLVWLKEYPHVDIAETAEAVFSILQSVLDGRISPDMAIADCRIISLFPTMLDETPIKAFVQKMRIMEAEDPDILNISLVHGFPWADVSDVGAKIVVTTNNSHAKGLALANMLADEIYGMRGRTLPKFFSLDQAFVLVAKSISTGDNRPVTFGDFSDNVGGGAVGDSTFILSKLLEHPEFTWCISTMYDPEAVTAVNAHDEGETIVLSLGGHYGKHSGKSIEVEAKILHKNELLRVNFSGAEMTYGRACALQVKSGVIIINDVRCQAYSIECLTNMKLKPSDYNILVAKSSEHFRASFSTVSSQILLIDTPGALTVAFSELPYDVLSRSGRSIWPVTIQDKVSQKDTKSSWIKHGPVPVEADCGCKK